MTGALRTTKRPSAEAVVGDRASGPLPLRPGLVGPAVQVSVGHVVALQAAEKAGDHSSRESRTAHSSFTASLIARIRDDASAASH